MKRFSSSEETINQIHIEIENLNTESIELIELILFQIRKHQAQIDSLMNSTKLLRKK